MPEIDKVYNPKSIEDRLYEKWETAGDFKPKGTGTPFSVVIPPPNVTGILHMGHALNLTLQDIIVRFQRMNGRDVLWVPGTDHAGIATQNVVERQLDREGIHRYHLGREEFVNRVWQWKSEYGERITRQIRKMGASVDWSHERFTMDEGCSKAVHKTFIDLYEKGLIYRGRYLINWCPRCKTALSDIEVEHRDIQSHIWSIRYPLESGAGDIVVATTRPETMFGDTAIAVHPDDNRYQHLIGQCVTIPLTATKIPIIADKCVDPAFGTGAVKITPAHDFNDFEVGQRHNLAQVVVMDDEGKMNENAPSHFIGFDRAKCRKALVEELDQKGFLVKIDDHALSIGECYRCHTVVEPYLSPQWFVNMKALAAPAIEAVKSGKIKFIPTRWEKVYFDWMENIRDWCISRQIWWGHQIPIWYCENHLDEPIASAEPLTQCPKCGGTELRQDEDVLDTWFSSGLWPFEVMGWPETTSDLERYYPTSLLVTGYDILTFWVSRMITMGLAQTSEIPFSSVYIHGLVRDASGKKMSKSAGNAMDPLQLIDTYGTDALRFALASLTTLGGQDIKLAEEKIESARNFANKIWNATRFILMILSEHPTPLDITHPPQSDEPADIWILSTFYTTLDKINLAYDQFNYSLIADLIWEFTWNQFCDWYIELSKLNKEKSLPTLIFILVNTLKLIQPVMPYITEELYAKLRELNIKGLSDETLMTTPWPKSDPSKINPQIEAQMAKIIPVIREIRNLRSAANLAPKTLCNVILVTETPDSQKALTQGQTYIQKLAKVDQLEILSSLPDQPPDSSAAVVDDIQIVMRLDGFIDKSKEKARLESQIEKIEAQLQIINQKLSNPGFLTKAPEPVVNGIKSDHARLTEELNLLNDQKRNY